MKSVFRSKAVSVLVFLILFSGCAVEDFGGSVAYELVTTINPIEGGSITPATGNFEHGDEVTIAATASPGYSFKNWSGDISGNKNPHTFTIRANTNIIAVFELNDTDKDGITDDKDECSDTPAGEIVNTSGCSLSQLDSDSDGVTDDIDMCPETPADEEADDKGCSSTQIDADGDGVLDENDQCEDTPEGEDAGENGCSSSQKDSDSDGVTDNIDQCANTPVDSEIDEFGCGPGQVDGDNDGVTNAEDECPNTPAGESVDDIGCAASQKDADEDGVNDNIDVCSNTPYNEDVDENGCAASQKDTDGDGVNDDLDQCPSTPEGQEVQDNGCSLSENDADEDGVTDESDECPNTNPNDTVDVKGCSASQKDSDNDGVMDDADQCPGTPDGESADESGCAESQKDSDGDGVKDNTDNCPDTPNGESVDADGCSEGQLDAQPPNVTSITVTEITATSFTVAWKLDEASKGYIRFGTTSGVYVGSTDIENDFLDKHIQPVGDDNPFPLNPGTTYYWQIFVEDENGNTGFSDEQTTTTLEEVARTYVPDDVFEQNLIDQGYDDVLDDYVLTENIENLQTITLIPKSFQNIEQEFPIADYTGIEDFGSIEELNIRSSSLGAFAIMRLADNIDLSNNQNLRIFRTYGCRIEGLDLSQNTSIEVLELNGDDFLQSYIADLSISPNNNVKILRIGYTQFRDEVGFDNLLSVTTSVEVLQLSTVASSSWQERLNIANHPNLRFVSLGGDPLTFKFINIKNGNNEILESFVINPLTYDNDPICIEADNPSYVSSILTVISDGETLEVNVSENCAL